MPNPPNPHAYEEAASQQASKPASQQAKPTRPQLAPPSAPFLGIAVKTEKGVSRGAQVAKSSKTDVPRITKRAHLGLFVQHEKWCPINETTFIKIREVENIGEFDGPTCEDTARAAARLYINHATRANGLRVKADGPDGSRVSLWSDLDQVTPLVPARGKTAALNLA